MCLEVLDVLVVCFQRKKVTGHIEHEGDFSTKVEVMDKDRK